MNIHTSTSTETYPLVRARAAGGTTWTAMNGTFRRAFPEQPEEDIDPLDMPRPVLEAARNLPSRVRVLTNRDWCGLTIDHPLYAVSVSVTMRGFVVTIRRPGAPMLLIDVDGEKDLFGNAHQCPDRLMNLIAALRRRLLRRNVR